MEAARWCCLHFAVVLAQALFSPDDSLPRRENRRALTTAGKRRQGTEDITPTGKPSGTDDGRGRTAGERRRGRRGAERGKGR